MGTGTILRIIYIIIYNIFWIVHPSPSEAADGGNFSFSVLLGEAYGEIMLAEKECLFLFLQSQKTKFGKLSSKTRFGKLSSKTRFGKFFSKTRFGKLL